VKRVGRTIRVSADPPASVFAGSPDKSAKRHDHKPNRVAGDLA
jgi:hypothetical protein